MRNMRDLIPELGVMAAFFLSQLVYCLLIYFGKW